MSYLTYDPATSKYPIRGFSNPNFIVSPDNTEDPYLDNVVLYLKGDGTNGSTAIVDESPTPKAISVFGNAQISTAQSKYGGSSILFDGSGDYLTTESSDGYTFGTGDFTIEGWLYSNATQDSSAGVIGNLVYANDQSCNIRFSTGNVLLFGNWNINIISLGAINNTEWTHIAISRESGTIRSFIDGALINTVANSTNFSLVSTCKIGKTDGLSTSFNGYLDSFRITKGVARYTTTFDPETDTYLSYPIVAPPSDPYIDNVVLHLKGDGVNGSTNIIDETGKTISIVGDTQISTAQSKYGGSSLYFDGSGDYLTTPQSFVLSDPFTIEAWIYFSTLSDKAIYSSDRFSIVSAISTGKVRVYIGTGQNVVDSNATLSTNTWTHVCFTLSGGTGYIFINGVLDKSFAYSQLGTSSSLCNIGKYHGASVAFADGYIDSLRITNGVARYTANFDPETDTYLAY